MDTKSSKCVHLVEGGTNGSQYVNMAPMGKTSLGRVIHARKRQKTSFTNLETHGDGSGYLACDTCSSGVPNEIVPAGIVHIGNILVGNNIGFQTRTKGEFLKSGGGRFSPCAERIHLDIVSNGTFIIEHCVRVCSIVSNSLSRRHHSSCGFQFFWRSPTGSLSHKAC